MDYNYPTGDLELQQWIEQVKVNAEKAAMAERMARAAADVAGQSAAAAIGRAK